MHKNLDKAERIALWSESNCLIITSIKDGQCIPPLEFISVKKAEKTLEKSNIIMSEFSGCVQALGGILVINPFNTEEITRNIDLALQMLPEEREQRLEIAYSFIENNSTQKWAAGFIADLKRNTIKLRQTDIYIQNKLVGLGLQSTLVRT